MVEAKRKARIHVHNGVVKFMGERNHAPNGQRKQISSVCVQIKLKAANTLTSSQQIIMETTSNFTSNAVVRSPEKRTLKGMI